ncbi:hypothetical protein OH492_11210 [Vibrio chagasii]|nr:hypothetical protein [Vibrio chagasii]
MPNQNKTAKPVGLELTVTASDRVVSSAPVASAPLQQTAPTVTPTCRDNPGFWPLSHRPHLQPWLISSALVFYLVTPRCNDKTNTHC